MPAPNGLGSTSKGVLTIPSRVIAACFALVGFAAAALVGTFMGNPGTTVLWRAILVMAACWLVGRAVGWIAHQAVREHIDNYKENRPIPDPDASDAEGTNVDVEDEGASGTQASAAVSGAASEAAAGRAASST